METASWIKIEELFAQALEKDESSREAFLEAACLDDPIIRAELESLLAAHSRMKRFIELPATAFVSDFLPQPFSNILEGKRCGPYRLIREIARGGMGEVYLAARADEQYEKQVAIKLVRRGMDTESILHRFRNERQILAELDHPNIARLLDGGVTEDGLPWLALEYVEGEPLNKYCQQQQLSIIQRLTIFRSVCAAVHYAHQHPVVHRDLKPSNILVTPEGVPKLLDFGIAKIICPESPEQSTDQTQTIMRLMTPGYASPEQIKGETVTTISDIYSLGLILYELLTDKRPYHVSNLSQHEIERIICEETPLPPSVAVKGKDTPNSRTSACKIEPASHTSADHINRLQRRLVGDLDDIVMMALRKEPQRRYTSAEQFSQDIQRYLDGLPVIASPDTWTYRSKKFIRRRKTLVAATAAIVLSLLTGIILAVWQARGALAQERIAKQQAAIAQQERDKARRISEFLRTTLSYANPAYPNPGHGRGIDIKIVDAIRDAENRIEAEFKDQPEVRGELHLTLGLIKKEYWELDSARDHFHYALEIFRELHGENHPRTIYSSYNLGIVEGFKSGNEPATISIVRQAVDMMRLNDPQNENLPRMLLDLGEWLSYRGGYAEAESLLLEARTAYRNLKVPEDDYRVIYISCRLGNIYRDQGDLDRAQSAYLEYLARLQRFPAKHEAGEALTNLGIIDYFKGDYQEAEKRLNEAEKLFSKYLGENYGGINQLLYYLASIHSLQGKHAMAEAETRRALQICLMNRDSQHPRTLVLQGLLSKVLIAAGQKKRGAYFLREIMAKYQGTRDKSNGEWYNVEGILGECLTLLKRFDEAEPLLNRSYNAYQPGPTCRDKLQGPGLVEVCDRLENLYEAWGKPEKAAQFRIAH